MWLSDDAVIEVDYDEPEEPTFDVGRGAAMADRLDAFDDVLSDRPTAFAVAASAHAATDASTLTDDVFELAMTQRSDERAPAADTDQPLASSDAPDDMGLPPADADPLDHWADEAVTEPDPPDDGVDVLFGGTPSDSSLSDVAAARSAEPLTFDPTPPATEAAEEPFYIDLPPEEPIAESGEAAPLVADDAAVSSGFDIELQSGDVLVDSFDDVWQAVDEPSVADDFSISIDTAGAAEAVSLDDAAPFDVL
jgi:hypothetical protein